LDYAQQIISMRMGAVRGDLMNFDGHDVGAVDEKSSGLLRTTMTPVFRTEF
jgi:hypothetical protein